MHFAELEVVGVGMMFVEVVLVAVYEIVFPRPRWKHFARSEVAVLITLLVEVELVVIVFPCHRWPFLVESRGKGREKILSGNLESNFLRILRQEGVSGTKPPIRPSCTSITRRTDEHPITRPGVCTRSLLATSGHTHLSAGACRQERAHAAGAWYTFPTGVGAINQCGAYRVTILTWHAGWRMLCDATCV
jgi:hypothetical protein